MKNKNELETFYSIPFLEDLLKDQMPLKILLLGNTFRIGRIHFNNIAKLFPFYECIRCADKFKLFNIKNDKLPELTMVSHNHLKECCKEKYYDGIILINKELNNK